MARIAYDGHDAAAFADTRHLAAAALDSWLAAVGRHLPPAHGKRLLDLGSGTGAWAKAFADSYAVIAVEPSEAMRARSEHPHVLAGDAEHIPLADGSVDAVWLSTVVHHVPDLVRSAHEIRRVLRPGGPVLIRSAFAGRHDTITLFRYFTEAIRVLDSFPSVPEVQEAFGASGFGVAAIEQVPQCTAASLRDFATRLRRAAHTPLQLISDQEYATGLARLNAAADHVDGPVIDALDLLVLR
ncbi:methyltransferase domain-containing protein [Actinoplanes sp. NPDC051470]|uniref:class I SAM-dependent methyltransferase n=1 Tax=Actinoplanes sp. NPDC051470 TaxID=3157224 RepID=UPI00343E0FEF